MECASRVHSCDGVTRTGELPFQQYPKSGPLADRLNLSAARVRDLAHAAADGFVYAYVLSTAKWNDLLGEVVQRGAAPNFQGGRVTLCTCKHSMRAGRSIENWKGTWIAGFTCSGDDRMQRLFYLMRVERAFASHVELWNALPHGVRVMKSMFRNRLGDIFEPGAGSEKSPRIHPDHPHRKHNQWKDDLDYRQRDRSKRIAPLLLGARNESFLWSKPCLAYDGRLTQGCKKLHSLANLYEHLAVIE